MILQQAELIVEKFQTQVKNLEKIAENLIHLCALSCKNSFKKFLL